jgi:hypothetical protein
MFTMYFDNLQEVSMRFFLNRNLTILLGGQFVSQMGDKFYILALAYWILETTHSSTKTGIMLFYFFFRPLCSAFSPAPILTSKIERKFSSWRILFAESSFSVSLSFIYKAG